MCEREEFAKKIADEFEAMRKQIDESPDTELDKLQQRLDEVMTRYQVYIATHPFGRAKRF